MRRVLTIALVLVPTSFAILTQRDVFAQRPTKTNPPSTTRKSSCEDEIKQANLGGWSRGFKEGFNAGFESTSLEAKGQKLGISFVVEDMDGADSFRFAAAEVIRTQFPDSLEIDPAATMKLWIHGTKAGEVRPGVNFQDIELTVYIKVFHYFTLNGKTLSVDGQFVLADSGGTYWAYTNEQKTQKVRELTYKVLSEFLQKWQQAARQ